MGKKKNYSKNALMVKKLKFFSPAELIGSYRAAPQRIRTGERGNRNGEITPSEEERYEIFF